MAPNAANAPQRASSELGSGTQSGAGTTTRSAWQATFAPTHPTRSPTRSDAHAVPDGLDHPSARVAGRHQRRPAWRSRLRAWMPTPSLSALSTTLRTWSGRSQRLAEQRAARGPADRLLGPRRDHGPGGAHEDATGAQLRDRAPRSTSTPLPAGPAPAASFGGTLASRRRYAPPPHDGPLGHGGGRAAELREGRARLACACASSVLSSSTCSTPASTTTRRSRTASSRNSAFRSRMRSSASGPARTPSRRPA